MALIDAVLRIRHELQYRMTPLPDVFHLLGEGRNPQIADLFSRIAAELHAAEICSVGYACRCALRQTHGLCLSSGAREALLTLCDSIGKYDLDGNLRLLDLTLQRLRDEANALQAGASARCRTYISLSVCTGLAAAVILA